MSRTQTKQRTGMPKAREIREFWAPKIFALGKVCDTDNILDPVTGGGTDTWQCFCCGKTQELDRAHITALAKGGDNDVSNLHMLCRACHHESEPFSGEAYWRWFLGKPFLSFLDPAHFTKSYTALGVRDARHAAEVIIARFGTDPEAFARGTQEMLREAYDSYGNR